MPDPPRRLSPGEASVDDILEALHDGKRVIIEQEFLGGNHELTLRFDGETYYCDTPTTLHRHSTREGMRRCLQNHAYGR